MVSRDKSREAYRRRIADMTPCQLADYRVKQRAKNRHIRLDKLDKLEECMCSVCLLDREPVTEKPKVLLTEHQRQRDGTRAAKSMMAMERAAQGIDPIRPRRLVDELFGRGSYNDKDETPGSYNWDD